MLTLQGRASEIKRSHSAEKSSHERSSDPFGDFGMEQTFKHILASHHMLTDGLAGWILCNADSLFTSL